MTSSTAPTHALHPATLAAHGGSSVADPYRDLAPPLHLSTTFERAADGTLRGRILSPDKHEGEIVHALTLAELAALKSWRLANLAAPVGFRWQGTGETYTVACFEPIQVRHLGPNLVLATVKLSEV